jgi:hypothetical protein
MLVVDIAPIEPDTVAPLTRSPGFHGISIWIARTSARSMAPASSLSPECSANRRRVASRPFHRWAAAARGTFGRVGRVG